MQLGFNSLFLFFLVGFYIGLIVLKRYSLIFFIFSVFLIAKDKTCNFIPKTTFPVDTLIIDAKASSADSLTSDSLKVTADSLAADSLQQKLDSLKAKIKAEQLIPIYQRGHSVYDPYSTVINNYEFYRRDYRYTGDIFSYISTGFLQDLGSLGQPNEVYLFGLGYNNITYLNEGSMINNRIFNTFDLNHFQSESLDSIEVLPLPRGFLYSSFNNPVSVNFIKKDRIPEKPYTRIRFYQAPDDEGYIDGQFNAVLRKNLIGYFQFTNNSVESRYTSSEYGAWKINTNLKYLLSNNFNIIAGYNYLKSTVYLNGGVNIDTLRSTLLPGQIDGVFYNNINAPVYYESRYRKETQHGFNLRFLGRFGEILLSDLNLYYNFSLTEFRQNEKNNTFGEANIPVIVNNNKYRTYGATFKQNFNYWIINFEAGAIYEKTEIKSPHFNGKFSFNSYSVWGRGSLSLLNGLLVPSAYIKYLNYDERNYPGFGTDVSFNPFDWLTLYAGSSVFKKSISPFAAANLINIQNLNDADVNTFEAGVKFNHPIISGKINYYRTENDNSLLAAINNYSDSLLINETAFYYADRTMTSGVSAKLDLKFWKIMLSGNGNYFNLDYPLLDKPLPQFTFFGGIYYTDILFDNNLDLRTGFNFRFFGSQSYSTYDFEKPARNFYNYDPVSKSLTLLRDEKTATGYQVDFFLNGIIQEAAIVYFVFENILGEEYYIFPYYPKQGRGLRFGLSWELFN